MIDPKDIESRKFNLMRNDLVGLFMKYSSSVSVDFFNNTLKVFDSHRVIMNSNKEKIETNMAFLMATIGIMDEIGCFDSNAMMEQVSEAKEIIMKELVNHLNHSLYAEDDIDERKEDEEEE